jgi:hypothetical protein
LVNAGNKKLAVGQFEASSPPHPPPAQASG